MRVKNLILFAIFFLQIVTSNQTLASSYSVKDSRIHKSCGVVIADGQRYFPSGGEGDDLPKILSFLEELWGDGGVAHRLGLARPTQNTVMNSAFELAALASIGHSPVAHWRDGKEISDNLMRSLGVYEFVTGSCSHCTALFRDSTPLVELYSIFMHVAGHNHFTTYGVPGRTPNTDTFDVSLALQERYRKALNEEYPPDVERFYRGLLSFTSLQDRSHGGLTDPKFLGPTKDRDKTGRLISNPSYPTWSGPQSIVANLPEHSPRWQKEIASLWERAHRNHVSIPPTKIMNEGFATLMMYILPKHFKSTRSRDAIDWSHLLANVMGANPRAMQIDNPYWLGGTIWLEIYGDFVGRPENRDLDFERRDRAFLKYATGLISSKTDKEFLRDHLSDRWVLTHDLAILRELEPFEYDMGLPKNTGDDRDNAQYEISSTDPRIIRDTLIERIIGIRKKFAPQILIESNDWRGTGAFSLRHQVIDSVPIKWSSAIQALFVLSKLLEKPAQLTSVVIENSTDSSMGGAEFSKKELRPVIVRVTGDGEVSVSFDDKTFNSSSELAIKLRSIVEKFLVNEIAVDRIANSPSSSQVSTRAMTHFLNEYLSESGAIPAFGSRYPGILESLDELRKTLQRNMQNLQDALKKGVVRGRQLPDGINLQVLPTIPIFELDHNGSDLLHNNQMTITSGTTTLFAALNGTVIGQIPGKKGDKIWGPSSRKDSSGEDGEGDQDGSNPGNGDQPGGDKGGNTNPRPSEVKVSYDNLVDMLDLEFPNLRQKRKGGGENRPVWRGARNSPEGEVNLALTFPGALSSEMARRGLTSIPNDSADAQKLFEQAWANLDPDDIVVSSPRRLPLIQEKAVLVFATDNSGSQAGAPMIEGRQFNYFLEAMLRKIYRNVEIRYVAFSSEAIEMSREKFYREVLGGGTLYKSGWQKAGEIFDEPKYGSYDKYLLTTGDFEDFKPTESLAELRSLIGRLSWSGAVFVGYKGKTPRGVDLFDGIEALKEEHRFLDTTHLDHTFQGRIKAALDMFGKKEN